jgi:hypothetical protein
MRRPSSGGAVLCESGAVIFQAGESWNVRGRLPARESLSVASCSVDCLKGHRACQRRILRNSTRNSLIWMESDGVPVILRRVARGRYGGNVTSRRCARLVARAARAVSARRQLKQLKQLKRPQALRIRKRWRLASRRSPAHPPVAASRNTLATQCLSFVVLAGQYRTAQQREHDQAHGPHPVRNHQIRHAGLRRKRAFEPGICEEAKHVHGR